MLMAAFILGEGVKVEGPNREQVGKSVVAVKRLHIILGGYQFLQRLLIK